MVCRWGRCQQLCSITATGTKASRRPKRLSIGMDSEDNCVRRSSEFNKANPAVSAAGVGAGNLILTVAVVAILISAPLGAIGVDNTYKKLLHKSKTAFSQIP